MSDALVANRQRPILAVSLKKAAKIVALALLFTAMVLWSIVLPVLGILYAVDLLR